MVDEQSEEEPFAVASDMGLRDFTISVNRPLRIEYDSDESPFPRRYIPGRVRCTFRIATVRARIIHVTWPPTPEEVDDTARTRQALALLPTWRKLR